MHDFYSDQRYLKTWLTKRLSCSVTIYRTIERLRVTLVTLTYSKYPPPPSPLWLPLCERRIMEVPGTTSRAGRVCLIVHCRPATNATVLLTQAYKSEKACMRVENGSGEQEAVQTKESVVTRARKDSRNGMGASEFVTRWCARPVNEVQDKDAGRVEVVMDENNLRGRYSSKRVHAAHTITNLHVIFVYEMYIWVCHSATCGENILQTGD